MEVILVLNAGSSSLKFQLLAANAGLDRQVRGQIDGIGVHPRLRATGADGAVLVDRTWEAAELPDLPAATEALRGWLSGLGGVELRAVGHRVVHGGPDFDRPVRVDADILARLTALEPLAPLHQPHNLAAIRVVAAIDPDLPQVACFDTAFHRGHPEHTDCYALPRALYDEGIRRYGFHGLSYEYIASRLPDLAPEVAGGRVIVAHLGSGASMCALLAGRSVEIDHGLHRPRRPADGHPSRPARPRRRPAPDRAARHGPRRGDAAPLQGLRPQGPLRRLQRHARPAGERRSRRRLRHRPFRPPRRAPRRQPRRRPRRPRRLRLHRRHRRALGPDPRPHRRAPALARRRARPGRQRGRRPPHLDARKAASPSSSSRPTRS